MASGVNRGCSPISFSICLRAIKIPPKRPAVRATMINNIQIAVDILIDILLDFLFPSLYQKRACFTNLHQQAILDRKSTRLNSSHANISYAVFCLKKKKQKEGSVSTTRS